MVGEGRLVVAQDDIANAFDHVPIEYVMEVFRRHIDDPGLLNIANKVLRGHHTEQHTVGIDQGSALSPLALNVALHHALDDAIRWLEDLAEDAPGCRFHYVLGNHDHMPPLMQRLDRLADREPNFVWHEYLVRLGSAAFLHGDIVERDMGADDLAVTGVEPITDLAAASPPPRKPSWLRMKRQGGEDYNDVKRLLRSSSLNTVCESANCPNRGECFGSRTATFMLMGDVCTRHCTFCNIPGGRVADLDPDEPRRVAAAVAVMGLEHCVVTSVCRDDLPDGGAGIFAETIRQMRRASPDMGVEVLIPDYLGTDLRTVMEAAPDILNHNVETVPRLYREMRRSGRYDWALEVLGRVAERAPRMIRKSGLMVGLGESEEEIRAVLEDLARVGCQVVTIGQYLRPTPRQVEVARYWTPEEFEDLASAGEELGLEVFAGPFVRSSYRAEEAFLRVVGQG